jgi:glucoamylase
MPREIPLGNGKLLITFDHNYYIRDIYYPSVGKENHLGGHRFGFGVWADGQFEWMSRDGWALRVNYADQTLLSAVDAEHAGLQLRLSCTDVVDYDEPFYIRRIKVQNLSARKREVRLFFHHDFHVSETSSGDTAYFNPEEKALIHYKANRYFLVSGMVGKTEGPEQYATGIKEFRGMERTWKDAEDGLLSGNPISQDPLIPPFP